MAEEKWTFVEQPPDEPGDHELLFVKDGDGRLVMDSSNTWDDSVPLELLQARDRRNLKLASRAPEMRSALRLLLDIVDFVLPSNADIDKARSLLAELDGYDRELKEAENEID